MQVAPSRRTRAGGALAEATLDALAADLTVPHARPLVDLERDEYADVEVDDEPATTQFSRPEIEVDIDVQPVVIAPRRSRARTQRVRPRRAAARWMAALATVILGFGLGATVASFVL